MGWSYKYLKSISKEPHNNICKKSKKGKKHKLSLFFMIPYCERCGVELYYNKKDKK